MKTKQYKITLKHSEAIHFGRVILESCNQGLATSPVNWQRVYCIILHRLAKKILRKSTSEKKKYTITFEEDEKIVFLGIVMNIIGLNLDNSYTVALLNTIAEQFTDRKKIKH